MRILSRKRSVKMDATSVPKKVTAATDAPWLSCGRAAVAEPGRRRRRGTPGRAAHVGGGGRRRRRCCAAGAAVAAAEAEATLGRRAGG